MAEAWPSEADEAERRPRLKATSPEQRLAWLRRMQAFARKTGALERARNRKLENTWKYGKQ